jgi:hypothetical protein
MTLLISGRAGCEPSDKVRSLQQLEDAGLPIPQTVVVKMFSACDQIPDGGINDSEFYYVRLCFLDSKVKRRSARIVPAKDLFAYIRELSIVANESPADLLIQPAMSPTFSGGALKIGCGVLIETVYGLPPTLFHRGRIAHRAVLSGKRVVLSQAVQQGVSHVLQNGSVSEISESGWDKYNPETHYPVLIDLIGTLDNVIVEWGVVGGGVVFFDHKIVPGSTCYAELRVTPPALPLCVTTSMVDVENSPLPRQTLFLEYPDLRQLADALLADYVVIKAGALLSHLAVYSLRERYKCVFHC